MATEEVREYLSQIRKQGHIDNPLPREHFSKMGKKSALVRLKKKTLTKNSKSKLSTDVDNDSL